MPKVSVIVPTYNYGQYLSDCFDSLLRQTMQDFEVVLIDDASTDNTGRVVERYKKAFGQRLKYKRLKERVGRGGVRNYGVQLATAAYLAFLDADDAYCPEKLEIQCKYLDEHPDEGAVNCLFYLANSRLQEPVAAKGSGGYLDVLFGPDYSIFVEGMVGLMLRREVIDQAGLFDESISRGQDTDMLVRIIRIAKIGFIPTPLYFYRYHSSNSPSRQAKRERTESNAILCLKIIASERGSRKTLAREYTYRFLKRHVTVLREEMYFYSIGAWLYYLRKFNFELPFWGWAALGLKVLIGHKPTQLVKRSLSRRTRI